ncbi:callose synthase 9-like protein [Trifolium pratense]|uniref:Callose synthase 9-like protein n=1 Tax=Trifolium pratense TaxID=57577 RepID=A0A2K3P133_TRIPR|nr:callose synthase 9-like protein [Trifolium pratense]
MEFLVAVLKLDEAALQKVFHKSLENYINWCNYLCITPVWSSLEAVGKEKKLLYVSLYLLIWGEASNVRFLPECLCYIFHHMAREMDEILRQQIAQTANSCTSENGVSFLDHVIFPLYDIISAALTACRVGPVKTRRHIIMTKGRGEVSLVNFDNQLHAMLI